MPIVLALSFDELHALFERAICAGNAELWFSHAPKKRKTAARICDTQCPVRNLCYRYALSQPPQTLAFGVWAGFETEEIQREQRKVRRVA